MGSLRALGQCRTGGDRRTDLRRCGEKKGLKAALAAEVIAEIEELIGPGSAASLDFEAMETAARRQVLALTARAVEQRLNADKSDYLGPFAPCRCGAAARYGGRRPLSITTVLGTMTLSRVYYHCRPCGSGFFPRDHSFGIEEHSLSPGVTRMVGLAAATASFEGSAELLSELAGVQLPAKQVERVAEDLGEEIAADEREHSEPETTSELPRTLYMGTDGTGLPMRPVELEGRAGKQPDGSSKTREAKLCVVWSAEKNNKDGIPERDRGSATYTAAIESAAADGPDLSDFAQRVEREAQRRRFTEASRHAVLGDGALWIWNLFSLLFPNAIQIVDLYHALERISRAAAAIWGAGSQPGEEWAHERREDLKEGRFDQLIAAFETHRKTSEEVPKLIGYLETNRERMRYPEFRAQNLCVSTGMVEAGCLHVIGDRLKQSGMRWTVRGANAITALRCAKLSGRFEDFWERRQETAKAA